MMLLNVENLRVRFRLGRGSEVSWSEAVGRGDTGVSFAIEENQTLALVGESGSGKSVTAMSIINLLPDNAERHGAISFLGRNLITASSDELRALRGRDIACVFQDPMSSLNPVFTVGDQLAEPLRLHLGLSPRQARERVLALLDEVGLPEPEAPGRRLSARALRRPAAARDDRDGDRLRAQAADRRRADHRARRDDPAPDPRAAGRAASRGTG